MTLFDLLDHLRKAWRHEETIHMRLIAERYSDRAHMDGDVIQKTGELVPRESA